MKPTREWVNANGVRCVEVDAPHLAGETMIDFRDLVQFLVSLDLRDCEDPEKLAELSAFRREVPALQPAVAHRRAVELLESFGAQLPDHFKSPILHTVKP